MRQLVKEQRVDSLNSHQRTLVHQLRDALFERRSSMSKMFKSVDLNDDGVVTLEEFLYALEGAGVHIGHEIDRARVDVSEEEAARLLSYFDRDGQGVLRYNEFMRLLQGTIEIAQPSVPMWRGSAEPPRGGRQGNESSGGQDNASMTGTGLIREAIGVGHGG